MTPHDSTATITGLRVRAVRAPMREPHRTASGVVAVSPLVLIDLLTDAGVQGHSIVFTYTPIALQPTGDLIRDLGPLVAGQALDPAAVTEMLGRRFRLLGTEGLVGMALAAIDMAAWDALARLHGVSLVRLLGGTERRIRAYGAIGYDGAGGAGRAAEAWARTGFTGVKAKIGYPTAQEDVAVIRAIRDAAGPETAIMVDYNQSLTPAEAVERLRVLDGEGLTWVEEPTLAHDYAGHALVAREIRTPIQCGESWWGPLEMLHSLEARGSDYVMPDVMKIGGVSGWLRAAELAREWDVPMSNHLWPEVSAQLLCCTPTAHWLEYADWWNPVLAEPLRVEDGMAVVDGTAGSGVAWNEAAVEAFAA
jgi:mandelate racemase